MVYARATSGLAILVRRLAPCSTRPPAFITRISCGPKQATRATWIGYSPFWFPGSMGVRSLPATDDRRIGPRRSPGGDPGSESGHGEDLDVELHLHRFGAGRLVQQVGGGSLRSAPA